MHVETKSEQLGLLVLSCTIFWTEKKKKKESECECVHNVCVCVCVCVFYQHMEVQRFLEGSPDLEFS